MATTSSSRSFVNVRWHVDGETRLSMSHWDNDDGSTTHAVALLRRRNNRWVVDGETTAEFRSNRHDPDGAAYRATHYGSQLVASVLGECPLRFFRDAAL